MVFTIVGYPQDVKNIILGENGVLKGMKSGGIIVDMTTSEPSLAMEINQQALKNNIFTIDAPVSGGDIGAKNGTLSIMLGGEKDIIDHIHPLLSLLGNNIKHMGKAGAGHSRAPDCPRERVLLCPALRGYD